MYYDNTPFDTKFNRNCTIVNEAYNNTLYKGLLGCCVSFDGSVQDLGGNFYLDSNCSIPANTANAKLSSSSLKVGDYVTILNSQTNADSCSSGSNYSYGRVENVTDGDSLYWGSPANCQPRPDAYKCYNLITYREITTEEARALFVCAE